MLSKQGVEAVDHAQDGGAGDEDLDWPTSCCSCMNRAATMAKSQSAAVSMSMDSRYGPSYIMGRMPMRALVLEKLLAVKM